MGVMGDLVLAIEEQLRLVHQRVPRPPLVQAVSEVTSWLLAHPELSGMTQEEAQDLVETTHPSIEDLVVWDDTDATDAGSDGAGAAAAEGAEAAAGGTAEEGAAEDRTSLADDGGPTDPNFEAMVKSARDEVGWEETDLRQLLGTLSVDRACAQFDESNSSLESGYIAVSLEGDWAICGKPYHISALMAAGTYGVPRGTMKLGGFDVNEVEGDLDVQFEHPSIGEEHEATDWSEAAGLAMPGSIVICAVLAGLEVMIRAKATGNGPDYGRDIVGTMFHNLRESARKYVPEKGHSYPSWQEPPPPPPPPMSYDDGPATKRHRAETIPGGQTYQSSQHLIQPLPVDAAASRSWIEQLIASRAGGS